MGILAAWPKCVSTYLLSRDGQAGSKGRAGQGGGMMGWQYGQYGSMASMDARAGGNMEDVRNVMELWGIHDIIH